jgi:hypothetical protein
MVMVMGLVSDNHYYFHSRSPVILLTLPCRAILHCLRLVIRVTNDLKMKLQQWSSKKSMKRANGIQNVSVSIKPKAAGGFEAYFIAPAVCLAQLTIKQNASLVLPSARAMAH